MSLLSINIDNLRVWQTDNWIKYETNSSKGVLKIHFDQLLIIANNKVLESLNIRGKIKGINKQDYLILIVCTHTKEIRKIKFQIKNDLKKCLQELGSRFPIAPCNSIISKRKFVSKFKSVDDVLRELLEKTECLFPLPHSPVIQNFVKLCVLDPTFPQMVAQIQEVIGIDTTL